MKTAWAIVLGTALTDFALTAVSSLVAAMTESGSGELPGMKTLIVACAGGLLVALRTIQAALKASSGITPVITGPQKGGGIR